MTVLKTITQTRGDAHAARGGYARM